MFELLNDDASAPSRWCAGTYIEASEFLRLLLSRRALVRCDTADGAYCGLSDRDSGRRYLIARSTLVRSLTA